MDLRRKLNENPMITGGIAVVIVVIAIWALYSFSGSTQTGGAAGTYYSTDNGATYFKTSTDELPPFQYDGKEAVRAYVFSCADGKEFVGYLEKYTPEAKQVMAQLNEPPKEGQKMEVLAKVQQASTRGKLVKKPDQQEWVSSADSVKAGAITRVKCPDGNPALPAE